MENWKQLHSEIWKRLDGVYVEWWAGYKMPWVACSPASVGLLRGPAPDWAKDRYDYGRLRKFKTAEGAMKAANKDWPLTKGI